MKRQLEEAKHALSLYGKSQPGMSVHDQTEGLV